MRVCYYNMLLRSYQCIRFKRVVGIVMKLREKPTRRFVRGLHDNNNNNRNTVQHHRRGREPFSADVFHVTSSLTEQLLPVRATKNEFLYLFRWQNSDSLTAVSIHSRTSTDSRKATIRTIITITRGKPKSAVRAESDLIEAY